MLEKKRVLIFETSVYGHHLEYLHHLHEAAFKDKSKEFYFVLPSTFNELKKSFVWQKSDNIHFVIIDRDVENIEKTNGIKSMIARVSLLKKYIREINAKTVLLIRFIAYLPILCGLLPKGVDVIGIVYKIYLYEKEQQGMSRLRLWKNETLYRIIAKSKVIKKLFILNDKDAATYFNEKYETLKFQYLPDPFVPIQVSTKGLREKYGLSNEKLFIHFGGIDYRKGTIAILKTIFQIEKKSEYAFIFAGRITGKKIASEFYYYFNKLKGEGYKVFVKDEFCSYEFLGSLCFACDGILMPYLDSYQSSGLLGYAAQYMKPVLGPSTGLIGHLIEENCLGVTVWPINEENILDGFKKITTYKVSSNYLINNTPEIFSQSIMNAITN